MKSIMIPPAALAQHIAVVGKTGSGKTSTAKLAIEQVVAEGARVCVLDPIKSDWWGMISSADGKRPGLPFHVLGGPHGHVPLHSGAGAAIAELVARGDLPLSIVDMAEFEPGGQNKFFVAFADTLLKRMRGVLYLVLEEAHEFAPKERAGFEKENLALHYAKKFATAGRSKGIRLIVATQRTQALHNALLGSCETMIVHRLTAPADQEPVLKWLKSNVTDKTRREEIAAGISSLKTGEGWLCSGEARIFERIQFPRIHTFDNSATPTHDGAEIKVTAGPVDFDKLRTLIGTAVTEAEANDPKLLKARIRELEAAAKRVSAPSSGDPADRAMLAMLRDRVRVLERVNAELKDYAAAMFAGAAQAQTIIEDELEPKVRELRSIRWPKLPKLNGSKVAAPAAPTPATSTAYARPPRVIPQPASGSSDLGKGERVLLTAIAQSEEADAEQLTVLTGYKRSSRDTYLQRLRSAGFVTAGFPVRATEAGLAALGDFEPLPTGDELARYWLERLGDAGEGALLRVLLDRQRTGIDRDELGDQVGYKRSSRDTYLQRLASRKLIEKRGGRIFASERLFG